MRITKLSRASVVLLAIVALSVYLGAQAVNFATIHGRVTDKSDAAVAGAEVKATQLATGLVRSTTSSADGDFVFPNLPVGEYKVRIAAKGFKEFAQTGITLTVGSSAQINARLEIGAVTETVEVHADAAMVETHENSVSTLIDNNRIMEMPLNGRQVTVLMTLTGGSSDTPVPSNDLNSSKNYGNGVAQNNPGGTVTVSVGGGQVNSNNFLLDGGDHNDGFSNVNAPFPFPDAVQEFSIQSSGSSARYGVHSGATVTAVTKSGTNSLHGTAFEFLRNPIINAHHVQFTQPAAGARDDTMKRNQFGGTLGGAIKKDKLFFFAGYQGTRQSSTPGATTATVPTAAVLAGDFTKILSSACNNAKTLKSAYATGNIIDLNAHPYNQQSLSLLKYIPVSTNSDGCGKVTFSLPTIWNEDQGIAKIDYNLSSKHSVFTRYFGTDSRVPVTFDGVNALPQNTASQFARYQSLAVGDTYSFNSGFVNSLHFTGTRLAINRGPAGNMINNKTIGIDNASPVENGMVLSVTNYFSVGGGSTMPGHFINNLYQLADDIDVVRGRHQLSFGVNFMKMQLNYLSNAFTNGQFTFGGATSGDNLADFLLGLPNNYQQAYPEVENWRYTYAGLYVHDNIKLRQNLTLNAGVRWEPYLPSKDTMNRGSHFDQAAFLSGTKSSVFTNAPAGLTYCGDEGVSCSFQNNQYKQFSPRVGLIWDPRSKGKETIRAGYGLFYDSPEMYYFDRFADNTPYGTAVTYAPTSFTHPYTGQTLGVTIPDYNQGGFPQPGGSNVFPIAGVYINNSADVHPTYVQSWNLAIEKQFGANWSASATYVGSKTAHIWVAYEANPALWVTVPGSAVTDLPGNGCATGAQPSKSNFNCRRLLYLESPSQGKYFSNMTSLWDGANANYNGLLLTAKHRFNDSFTLLSNYTWSHCSSDQEFSGELTNSRPTLSPTPWVKQSNGRTLDYGNCVFDIRQNFNTSLVVNSPKMQGRIAGAILNNWQLAPLVSYRTGQQFSVTTGADTASIGATTSTKDRPNQVGDPFSGSCTGSGGVTYNVGDRNCYFNPAAFVTETAPAATAYNGTMVLGPFGNAGRNSLSGPGAFRFDAAISRKFAIREGKELNLRFETFNLLNHPVLGNPNSALSSATKGQITSQIGDGRTFQGAIKYTF